ncbi:hypothetical protein [Altericista sp. CCNU0014]|uniref:hypothetical protein n=1 Tax=Altericista sp. CCNU0014 TaxID=3082949 RepID=UPI003850CD57
MIRHISIDACNPLRVASVLAEILSGKVYKFLIPGSYLLIPFDDCGTHIVVLKEGDVWVPGTDTESAQIRPAKPTHFAVIHAAISVSLTQQEIEQIARREGWRVLTRKQEEGAPFSAIEFWVENRILLELFVPEFVPQYMQVMQPEAIAQILGQSIEPVAV